ncbi:hypothetical protein A2130_04000 [Candidatus Woesebacteria bacterium GWC2_33_12]|uniref:Uncharacterized protein n=1 Tax=Candidatus Woesebacteria bacterium GW2011_GWB1_33_22 TaxID=1618566 RepID=A0A0G0CQA8_9BACT|nr:MAG: hypothetical protein UR29_C0001G0122 [Candidatus Woesebacteria bacterium GW2011_GWC2_33_12]KKP42668.1 MAG: hypothetical protein UR33_C0001G0029 [Candidatus Woesebacteria bacterium GW2011_GWA2_33_20]KKP45557.1 MAG: hypothetical protein UR35_C0001G0154 [Candidatus Woesebacteria bacterium GW2011_GWB1_33_22]KKP47429.1 MAG: hypothetical protein UR37_C0001G0122 [Microgenomates group bacterium GW2011_GWC1_33_28]KKP51175.1 MAG: hypothetical protein UR41_C0001G0122 [Candidatus Woesebacteria bact
MTKQSLVLGLGALVVGVGIFAITTSNAFENKDFNARSNLMQGKGKVTQVVNKDNFAKFVEAQKIQAELGLGMSRF